MNTKTRISEKEVCELYDKGYSQEEIAEKLNCHQGTVSNKLKQAAETIVDWDKWSTAVIDMYIHGKSVTDIADMVGCSEWLIDVYIRANKNILDERTIALEVSRLPKPQKRLMEVGKLVVDHSTGTPYYDYTDAWISRWGTEEIPQWKLDLQKEYDISGGKRGVNFGFRKGVKYDK